MPAIRVLAFDGLIPRRSPTALENNQAQIAENVKLYSKELRAWRGPSLAYAPVLDAVRSFYLLDNGTSPIWLTWDTDVRVVPGPIADILAKRIYFTGNGSPKKTDYALASGSVPYPADSYEMGVPAPATAPSASAAAYQVATFYLNISSFAAAGDAGSVAGSVTVTAEVQAVSGNNNTNRDTLSSPKTLTIKDSMRYEYNGDPSGLRNTGWVTDTVTLSKTPTAIHLATLTTNAPTAAPDTVNTAEPTLDTRVYIYTFISTFGTLKEESAPSPPSNLVTAATGTDVTLSGIADAPAGDYNITHVRVYRSVTGETTDSYQFVAEIEVGTTTYADSASVTDLGEVITTIGWNVPPTDLDGLVSMPFGSLAGFSGNTVYFSEPYFPHAWPAAYAISVSYPIVGLGVFGSSLVVMTTTFPYILSGSSPDGMSSEQLPLNEPCVSARSITSDEQGVIYASPNGLVSIGNAARGVITTNLFRRDEWQALVPSTMSGDMYDGKYFGVFSADASPTLVLSRDDTPSLSFVDFGARELWVEPTTAKLYFIDAADNGIYEAEGDTDFYTYTWRSKRFALPKGISFSVVKVDADYSALSGSRTLDLLIYGDDAELIDTVPLDTYDPIRLEPFRSRDIEFELVGNLDVRSISFATSVSELRE